MLSYYLIPLAPFVFIAFTSAVCLFFFLCLKHEMRSLKLRWSRRQTEQESAIEELKAQVAGLSIRLLDAEERTGVLVPPMPPRSGLNLNKRSQVIRMSRRGEPADHIAASLNLPRREVELLLKIHGNMDSNFNNTNSQAVNS